MVLGAGQASLEVATGLGIAAALLVAHFMNRTVIAAILKIKHGTLERDKNHPKMHADIARPDEFEDLARSVHAPANTVKTWKQAHVAAQAQYDDILASMADAMLVIDAQGVITHANRAAAELFGFSRQALVGQPIENVIEETTEPPFLFDSDAATFHPVETYARTKNGGRTPVAAARTPLKATPRAGSVFILENLSARKAAENNLQYMATHDTLTSLPNRVLFMDRLQQALTRAPWRKRQVAVLLLDLDRFKVINSTLGHEVGDKLLTSIAARLCAAVRPGDTVARLGGDEFGLILGDMGRPDDVLAITEKITRVMNTPIEVNQREFFLTASIGISVYPRDGEDAATLLRNADAALYRAKEQGKNTYEMYSPTINARAAENMDLEAALRRALQRGEFVLHYQPQFLLSPHCLVGAEALIRWNRDSNGLVSPLSFIPLAEETGLIIPIGEWVLHTACLQARAWRDAGLRNLRVSVNLSDSEFKMKNLIEIVEYALKDAGLEPGLLELELTERIIMEDADSAVATLHEIKAMGVKLSIDDFGTGYSSLNHLKRFPLNSLKVDRSFVKDIPSDPDDMAITAAIIAMAHNLRLTVIAEGVEDHHQLQFLREHRCDVVQGFLFSHPVPADKIPLLHQALA